MRSVGECASAREVLNEIGDRARFIEALGKVVARVVLDDEENIIGKGETEGPCWPQIRDLGALAELAGELARDIDRLAGAPQLAVR